MSSRINSFEVETYSKSRFNLGSSVNKIEVLQNGVITICDQLSNVNTAFSQLVLGELKSSDFQDEAENILKLTALMTDLLKSIMTKLFEDTLVRIEQVLGADSTFAQELADARSKFEKALSVINDKESISVNSNDSMTIENGEASIKSSPEGVSMVDRDINKNQQVFDTLLANSSPDDVIQCKDGTIRKVTLNDGKTYDVYVPDGANVDTPIMLYEHGDSGFDKHWENYKEMLTNGQGSDAIIVHGDRKTTSDFFNNLVSASGSSLNLSPHTVGYSGGAPAALQDAVNILNANPDAKGGVVTLLDGVNVSASNARNDLFKERGTTVLAVVQDKDSFGTAKQSQAESMAKAGVNTLILYDKSTAGVGNGMDKHRYINNTFTTDGLMEYSLGTGSLPDRYEIKYYNTDTKKFETVDYNQVSTMDKVNEFFKLNM